MEIFKGTGFSFWKKYKRSLRQVNFKIPGELWLVISFAAAIFLAIVTITLIQLLSLPVSALMSPIVFIVALDLLAGYPYILAVRRNNYIEESLPDALKQMADILKSGGTYEYALREIVTAGYGPLSKELENVLRKLEEGENLENSLNSFSENVDSTLIKRTISIINDSIKAGAGLADVLDEIADDVRELHRIARERLGGTILQVIFIVVAGSMIAPLIIGLISTVINLLMETAIGLDLTPEQIKLAMSTNGFIILLLQAYILIEVIASSIMVALMREGKMNKSIIYIPLLLLIAYTCFYLAAFVSSTLIGGIK
ncbi:MAG: type II secretion system F family protein [Candidatus Diapherotrites archaeon]|uniref:Type II secretion system F family protein n=1 Tax=Candidatus Iainarchaeum sp. TaxID=3101447 RepID=A0A939CAP7_9ARCH|nr:type II secretion system F family protein [Candidatus Diapherotrites archaeon]